MALSAMLKKSDPFEKRQFRNGRYNLFIGRSSADATKSQRSPGWLSLNGACD